MRKALLVALFSDLIIQTQAQDISVGLKTGGSKWIDPEITYTGINPEIGVFVRSEPIKRLAIDLSFSGYSLNQDFSNTYRPSIFGEYKQDIKCRAVSLGVQYNYLRLFRNTLKLYAGIEFSPTYTFLTIKSDTFIPQNPQLTPYLSNKMQYWIYMLGINQSIVYQLGSKINLITTVSYLSNVSQRRSPYNQHRLGYSRIGLQVGTSYQIN